MKPATKQSRIVICEVIYYQDGDGQPISIESRYAYNVPLEQPYVRHKDVGVDFTKLDHGWVDGDALVCLTNEGQGINDTLILSFNGIDGHIPILQKRSIRVGVVDVNSLWIRSEDGKGRYSLTLFKH